MAAASESDETKQLLVQQLDGLAGVGVPATFYFHSMIVAFLSSLCPFFRWHR